MSMIQYVTVIGSGTMGNGIAHIFAQHGFNVSLIDVNATALSKALITIEKNLERQVQKATISEEEKVAILQRIATFTTLKPAVINAQLVIEAATEELDIKLTIFRELDRLCSPETILASNTSAIAITRLAAETSRPDKVVGMHFMNPVPLMKLVEIIQGHATSPEVVATILQIAKRLEKTPVTVQDYPGFIANRILMPMVNEAIYSLYEGVAGVHEIDTIMKLGMAHPMGPLQLADFIGLDVCLAILRVLHDGFGNPKYAPCPLLVNMVAAKQLGKKAGIGFYDYHKNTKDLKIAARFEKPRH